MDALKQRLGMEESSKKQLKSTMEKQADRQSKSAAKAAGELAAARKENEALAARVAALEVAALESQEHGAAGSQGAAERASRRVLLRRALSLRVATSTAAVFGFWVRQRRLTLALARAQAELGSQHGGGGADNKASPDFASPSPASALLSGSLGALEARALAAHMRPARGAVGLGEERPGEGGVENPLLGAEAAAHGAHGGSATLATLEEMVLRERVQRSGLFPVFQPCHR